MFYFYNNYVIIFLIEYYFFIRKPKKIHILPTASALICLSCSLTQWLPTLCNPTNCSTTGFSVLHYLPEFAQAHVHWVGDAIQPSHSVIPFSSCSPSIRVFSNESTLHIRWPKYWNFSFIISPSNEYSGLISFRTDRFDLAVQGTLKSLHQHHSLKASIIQC